MTSTTHNFIELSDLIGIKMECAHCHLLIVIPLERADRIPQQCPNCYEMWMLPMGDGKSVREHIDEFRIHLSALKRVLEGTDKFKFSLELSAPVSSAKGD